MIPKEPARVIAGGFFLCLFHTRAEGAICCDAVSHGFATIRWLDFSTSLIKC